MLTKLKYLSVFEPKGQNKHMFYKSGKGIQTRKYKSVWAYGYFSTLQKKSWDQLYLVEQRQPSSGVLFACLFGFWLKTIKCLKNPPIHSALKLHCIKLLWSGVKSLFLNSPVGVGVLQPEATHIWVNVIEDKIGITVDFSENRTMQKSVIFISLLWN